jgi:beta-xylosidase
MVRLPFRDRVLLVVAAFALLVIGAFVRSTAVAEIAPVIDRNFPDPDVMSVGSDHYAYSTQSRYGNEFWHVPVAHSTELTGGWTPVGDALPVLPAWSGVDQSGHADVTAPDVSARPGGGYLLYFVARARGRGVLCIGAAAGDKPQGPFIPGPAPLVCQPSAVDSIDPQVFRDDDGTRYLLFASGQVHTSIWQQRLAPDGLGVTAPPVPLIRADRPEEANIVEAPALVKHGDEYVLFYSGNRFDSGRYFVNYAIAPALNGPFVKHCGQLLNRRSLGGAFPDPGGQNVVADGEQQDLAFHASTASRRRSMFLVGLSWNLDGQPVPDVRDGLTHPYGALRAATAHRRDDGCAGSRD